MMHSAWRSGLAGLAVLAASLAHAQTPPNVPAAVTAKINALTLACRAAGGTPVTSNFVFVYDFTGDGRSDYLVSEGNFNCQGKPELFRPGGRAAIEIYVDDGRGGATRAFRDTVVGYQIVNRQPRVVAVMRSGPVCGPQGGSCRQELQWNPQLNGFVVAGAGAAPGAQASSPPAAPVDPLAGVGVRAAAAPPPASGGSAAATAAGAPETQPAFLARCRREILAKYANARGVDDQCKQKWTEASAALPAVDVILSLAPAQPGPPPDVAVARTKLAGVRWSPRAVNGEAASGKLGLWDVSLIGKGTADQLTFRWGKVGDMRPFDVMEGFKVRGAALTEVACLGFGASEQTHVYRVNAAGRAPFGLTIYDRGAATASASAEYSATADLKGGAPTLAAIKRTRDGADFQAKCEE